MTSMGFLRNPLVEIDHKGNAVPDLAESWEAEPGAKVWVFNLRKGVEFHNSATDLPQRAYDPDKARFHLKKAGMEGETFKLHTSDAATLGLTASCLVRA
jgi:peptide/nickel transport system substrate-binding protein